jgi:TonB family protein
VSNSVVRTRLIFALLGALLACFAVSAQPRQGSWVRIHCPPPRPHLIKIVRPIYPPLARQINIPSAVTLECLIGRDGSVKKVEAKKGHPLFIKAAIDAVSQWKYKPLLLNGQPVETELVIDIDFQLLDDEKQPDSTR